MKACLHLHTARCPHNPLTPSIGTCETKCTLYTPGDREWSSVRLTIRATSPKPAAVPREKWPMWAAAIALLKSDEDIGVGSTIERELGRAGKAFKVTMRTLGIPCGCNRRRAEFDALYPYA